MKKKNFDETIKILMLGESGTLFLDQSLLALQALEKVVY